MNRFGLLASGIVLLVLIIAKVASSNDDRLRDGFIPLQTGKIQYYLVNPPANFLRSFQKHTSPEIFDHENPPVNEIDFDLVVIFAENKQELLQFADVKVLQSLFTDPEFDFSKKVFLVKWFEAAVQGQDKIIMFFVVNENNVRNCDHSVLADSIQSAVILAESFEFQSGGHKCFGE